MGTIADKLSYLNNTKQAIKTSLENKGKDTTGKTFREYAGLIDDIEAGGAIEPFITDASSLFEEGRRLNSLEQLLNLISTDCNNMSYMFSDCRTLTSLDLSSFDTANVTNMSYMFNSCYVLTSLDLSSFDTSNVTNMSGMFNGCRTLTSLDLSSFDTSNVTNMSYMFDGCSKLAAVLNFSIDGEISTTYMFEYCSALVDLTFKPGSGFGNGSTRASLTLDLGRTAMTRDSIINMINSCSANTSGRTRIFKFDAAAFSTLTTDDIALFTDKNYSVISA